MKYIVTCQAHPVLVKKANQMCGFFLNFLWYRYLAIIPGPVSCRCLGGLLKTPPRWHATIFIFIFIYLFFIFIDREAFAKQRDNALGSVCPSVCLSMCLFATVYSKMGIRIKVGTPRSRTADAVYQLLIQWTRY